MSWHYEIGAPGAERVEGLRRAHGIPPDHRPAAEEPRLVDPRNLYRRQGVNTTRISKRQFYLAGGFSNPRQHRKMKSGVWTYWRTE